MAQRMLWAATKVCKKCGVEKAVEEFRHRVCKGAPYVEGKCIPCKRQIDAERLRAYRKHSGHKIQEHHRQRYENDPEYRDRITAKDARKYQRHKTERTAWQRKYRKDNPEKSRLSDWKNWLRKEYGLTYEKYQSMLVEQNHKCLICDRKFTVRRHTHVDHCHATGVVRGILCNLCNIGLGSFRDRPDLLLKAVDYLKTRSSKRKNTA